MRLALFAISYLLFEPSESWSTQNFPPVEYEYVGTWVASKLLG